MILAPHHPTPTPSAVITFIQSFCLLLPPASPRPLNVLEILFRAMRYQRIRHQPVKTLRRHPAFVPQGSSPTFIHVANSPGSEETEIVTTMLTQPIMPIWRCL
ncbi:hypothetical protein NXS19_013124 [Fusarium pseudograminearum]|nr:hypothetical protein NXS19_013124 [Fusarium pseudograminearum]